MIDKNTKLVDLTRLAEYKALSDKLYAKKTDVETDVEKIITNGHEFVDLGIVLSNGNHLLWAACNVGATVEYESGLYFAWGETEGYADGSGHEFTSDNYQASSISNNLTLAQDAARVNMGGRWRMPTKEEFNALIDSTTYNGDLRINGKAGSKFIASNGNSIFMPSAGGYSTWRFNYGQFGFYYSSSIGDDGAWRLKTGGLSRDIFEDRRFFGFSVRGVIELTDEELNNIKNPSKFYTKSETDAKIQTLAESLATSDIKEDEYSEDEILNVINSTT